MQWTHFAPSLSVNATKIPFIFHLVKCLENLIFNDEMTFHVMVTA
jgi:hypothetical protein